MIGPILEGVSVRLRPLAESDATATYLSWFTDREVTRFLEARFSPPSSVEELRDYVRDLRADPSTYAFAVEEVRGARHVGNIKLGPIDSHHNVGDIGIMLGDRSCWGQGFATQAISLLTTWAFDKLGVRKLTAGAYSTNVGSIRAFERSGFLVEATRRAQYLSDEGLVDGVLLARFTAAD